MSDPLVPNYKKNVGRLVTDRFDFESHKEGTDFRHQAGQIDLFPKIVIDGNTKENVQDAISSLANVIYSPSLPDATISSKGVIKINGDISGTADTITVSSIQGKPISTLVPSAGQSLIWDGVSWTPTTLSGIFTASQDLAGNNLNQQVIQISGDISGNVLIPANNLIFSETSIPSISQSYASSTDGVDLTLTAQSALGNGGNVVISGGYAGLDNAPGGVKLSVDNHNSTMIQATKFSDGRRVLSLLGESDDGEVPDGDLVLYIKEAADEPSSGSPTGGVLLYCNNGQLNILESTGNQFVVGSMQNPNIWGYLDSGNQVYSTRTSSQTTTNTANNIFSYLMPNNSSVYVDVTMIGKQVGSSNSSQISMFLGYSIDSSGGATPMGSLSAYDYRDTGAPASGWDAGDIVNSGATLLIKTGFNAATTINWFAVVKLSIIAD
jgi:hypothetical protein